MKALVLSALAALASPSLAALLEARAPIPSPQPVAGPAFSNVTYLGVYQSGAEAFVGMRYGQDTGGSNRFKPPQSYTPPSNTVINATLFGAACPQNMSGPPLTTAPNFFNFAFTRPASTSEDCLRLNVWRPNGTKAGDKLPVLVWIYGGSLVDGNKDNIIAQPGGLIQRSVLNGNPIIHVQLAYRIGIFGFAQSQALAAENAQNGGLKDQRLALEWVQANIAAFGGDPTKVTIHGQSSGGLSVGLQAMAYGASKGVPFQRGIAESQVAEQGITGNFTRQAQATILKIVGCDGTAYDSAATIACLRKVPFQTLIDAQAGSATNAPSANIGDQWLPIVDGDFLPAPPSQLIAQGRVANVSVIFGWTQTDGVYFVPMNITTATDTQNFARQFLPAFTNANIQKLLSLYPVGDFPTAFFPNGTVSIYPEHYRSGRILRDILFTCQAIYYGQQLTKQGNNVYFYQWNQSVIDPILNFYNFYGYGPIHTAELGYIFGNITHYHQYQWPFHPTASDFTLQDQGAGTWASFTALGKPSVSGKTTLQGWQQPQYSDSTYGVNVVGGPNVGYTGSGGSSAARSALLLERLSDRCGFLNSPEILKQLQW